MKKFLMLSIFSIYAEREFDICWQEMKSVYNSIRNEFKDEEALKKYHTDGWHKMRSVMAGKINGAPNKGVLTTPDISIAMARQGFKDTQRIETIFLQNFVDQNTLNKIKSLGALNDKGMLQVTSKEFSCSTNSLGCLYYAARVIDTFGSDIKTFVEFGGGYGCLAKIFKSIFPNSTYIIIDLPESLALQYLFLKYTKPDANINVVLKKENPIKENSVNLVPVYIINEVNTKADIFISTFALNETPKALQQDIFNKRFFDASKCYIASSILDGEQIFRSIKESYNKTLCSSMHLGFGVEIIGSK